MTEQNGFNPSDIQNMDPKKENAFQADNAATDHGTWEKADDGVAAASSDTAAGSPYTDGSVPADAPDLNSAESIPSADAYTDPTGFGTQADASYPYYGTQETPYPPYTPQKRKAKAKKEKKPHHGAWLALVIACAFLFSFAGGAAGFAVAQNGLPFFNNASGSSGSESSSGDSVLQTGDGSSTAATTTSEVTELVANSVVEITTESVTTGSFFEQQILTGAGSGVIVTADGYIVTNNHVIEDSSRITVTLRDGTQYDATLVGTDEKTDLAVLKIDASGLQPAVFGSSSDLKVGEQAIVIGNPLGQLGGSVTSGSGSSGQGTSLRQLASKADSSVLNAFETLGFELRYNTNAPYSGAFNPTGGYIELKKADGDYLLHELGHFVSFLVDGADSTSEFKEIFQSEKSKYTASNKAYVLTDSAEYFAESYKNYKENPSKLRSERPQTYEYIASCVKKITPSLVSEIKGIYGYLWK